MSLTQTQLVKDMTRIGLNEVNLDKMLAFGLLQKIVSVTNKDFSIDVLVDLGLLNSDLD